MVRNPIDTVTREEYTCQHKGGEDMMAVITAEIPAVINKLLEKDKKRLGLSKSFIVRAILQHHYDTKQPIMIPAH